MVGKQVGNMHRSIYPERAKRDRLTSNCDPDDAISKDVQEKNSEAGQRLSTTEAGIGT
jgi:hypothetical protein